VRNGRAHEVNWGKHPVVLVPPGDGEGCPALPDRSGRAGHGLTVLDRDTRFASALWTGVTGLHAALGASLIFGRG
jgi:hypothetical protein